MPPRKPSKEAVQYPASKRKAPPYKPPQPSKAPRLSTTDSESSRPKAAKKTVATARKASTARSVDDDDDDEDGDEKERTQQNGAEASDSDEELADDPLSARAKPNKPPKPKPAALRKIAQRDASPMSITSSRAESPRPDVSQPPQPSQPEGACGMPQALLIRLLHEHFNNKSTKIDKDAIQVLQKYVEVFVREAIARTALAKKEVGTVDAEWLELEDLEKVAPGMLLDF